MGKLKRCICLLIAVVFLAAVVPTVALADDSTSIYVSNTGNDELGNGTQSKPYATLAKAADKINDDKGKDYTIYIMSNLTMTASARFWDNNVSIQSDPEELEKSGKKAFTLSRAETGFGAVQDPARGNYNGALIEINGTVNQGVVASLYLENIVLDDQGIAASQFSEKNIIFRLHQIMKEKHSLAQKIFRIYILYKMLLSRLIMEPLISL